MRRKISFIAAVMSSMFLVSSFFVCDAATVSKSHKIPAYMPPGTKISYDKNDKMTVEKSTIDNNSIQIQNKINSSKIVNLPSSEAKDFFDFFKNSAIRISSSKTKSSLPNSQPGMTVTYDGSGDPVFIRVNGNLYYNSSVTKTSSVRPMDDNDFHAYEGQISFYEDEVGQADHVLGDYDCATDMYNDDCALGTDVLTMDWSTYPNLKQVWLQKWDVGNLFNNGHILDIRYPVFNGVFGYSRDDGIIPDGGYDHW